MRTPNSFLDCQMSQKGDRLNGLAQPHFVSQNRIMSPIVKCIDPINPQQLVLSEWEFYQK